MGLISFCLNKKNTLKVVFDKSNPQWQQCNTRLRDLLPTVIYHPIKFKGEQIAEHAENLMSAFSSYYSNQGSRKQSEFFRTWVILRVKAPDGKFKGYQISINGLGKDYEHLKYIKDNLLAFSKADFKQIYILYSYEIEKVPGIFAAKFDFLLSERSLDALLV